LDLGYAQDLLMFLITMCYSVLQPIVVPFGLFYFGVSYWAHKHNMIYAYTQTYQDNNLTPRVVTLLAVCLIFFQVTVAGALGLKQFPVAVLAIVPAVATCIFVFGYLVKRFEPVWKFGVVKLKYVEPLSNLDVVLAHEKDDLLHYLDPAVVPPTSLESYHRMLEEEAGYDIIFDSETGPRELTHDYRKDAPLGMKWLVTPEDELIAGPGVVFASNVPVTRIPVSASVNPSEGYLFRANYASKSEIDKVELGVVPETILVHEVVSADTDPKAEVVDAGSVPRKSVDGPVIPSNIGIAP